MIRFTAAARAALLSHAREGAPAEVCGVLGGERIGSGDRRDIDAVTETRRVTNVAETPESRYELDPAEQFRAMCNFEDAGLETVGFYHSHPRGPDGPSLTDERLATWPDRVYCIVSLGSDRPSVRAWRWTGDGFAEATVTVGSDP